jgi:hypothetical protein
VARDNDRTKTGDDRIVELYPRARRIHMLKRPLALRARFKLKGNAPTSSAAASRRLVKTLEFASNDFLAKGIGKRAQKPVSNSKLAEREGFEPDSDPQSDQEVTESENNSVPGDPQKTP